MSFLPATHSDSQSSSTLFWTSIPKLCSEIAAPELLAKRAKNFPAALCYQLITDRFTDFIASSNGEQMLWPFCGYATGKGVVVECAGLSENWFGDLDRIVKGKRSDRISRRAFYRRKPLGKFYASGDFDPGNKFT